MQTFLGEMNAAIGFALGALCGVAATLFLTIWREIKERRQRADLQREWDKAGIQIRGDLSAAEKETYEVKIDRGFARELERIDRKADIISRLLSWFAALGGAVGFSFYFYKIFSTGLEHFYKMFTTSFERLGDILMPASYAATSNRPDLAPFLPYIFMCVLLIMGLAFIIAVVTQFLLPDTKENHSRIRAADNIVKTFGGFFTGLATTLLN